MKNLGRFTDNNPKIFNLNFFYFFHIFIFHLKHIKWNLIFQL